jgi:hypothetical protein
MQSRFRLGRWGSCDRILFSLTAAARKRPARASAPPCPWRAHETKHPRANGRRPSQQGMRGSTGSIPREIMHKRRRMQDLLRRARGSCGAWGDRPCHVKHVCIRQKQTSDHSTRAGF